MRGVIGDAVAPHAGRNREQDNEEEQVEPTERALGVEWTAQWLGWPELGWLEGVASNGRIMAALGPLVAGLGVALGYVSLKRSTSSK